MEEKEIIAKNLELYRKKANLSQLELAKELNYSNKNISKWENAETTPSIFILHQIANLYNIKVDDLLNPKTVESKEEPTSSQKLVGRKKNMFRLAMLALANAIMFTICTIAIYVLGLVNVSGFNMWMLYLYLTPLTVLSVVIYIRVIYKYVSLLLVSLFGWLICICVYVSLKTVTYISLTFILGAAYQLMAIFITIIVNLKLSTKVQSLYFKLFNRAPKTSKEKQKS